MQPQKAQVCLLLCLDVGGLMYSAGESWSPTRLQRNRKRERQKRGESRKETERAVNRDGELSPIWVVI